MATLVKIQGNAVFNGGVKFQVTGVNTPLTPSLSSITSNGFTLSWDQVQDAFEYQLDISTNSNFSSFVAGYNNTTVPTTSAVVTGLSPQTTYWARIRAVVASTNSASVSGTTLEATSTLTNGLLAFYKLSDTSDSSGNNRTLTNNGGVTFSAGKIGNAAIGNGSGYLISPSLLQPQSAMSITTWFKTEGTGQIEFCGFSDTSGLGFALLRSSQGPVTAFICSTQSPPWQIDVNGTWNNNAWHHMALTWDGSVAKVYMNGSLGDSKNITGAPNNGVGSGFNILRIGAGGTPANSTSVDSTGVWNRALTDAEITELYNSGNGLEIN